MPEDVFRCFTGTELLVTRAAVDCPPTPRPSAKRSPRAKMRFVETKAPQHQSCVKGLCEHPPLLEALSGTWKKSSASPHN
jgi:hypothetical protein